MPRVDATVSARAHGARRGRIAADFRPVGL